MALEGRVAAQQSQQSQLWLWRGAWPRSNLSNLSYNYGSGGAHGRAWPRSNLSNLSYGSGGACGRAAISAISAIGLPDGLPNGQMSKLAARRAARRAARWAG